MCIKMHADFYYRHRDINTMLLLNHAEQFADSFIKVGIYQKRRVVFLRKGSDLLTRITWWFKELFGVINSKPAVIHQAKMDLRVFSKGLEVSQTSVKLENIK